METYRGNTGHVMVVGNRPGPVKETQVDGEHVRYVEVNVIDSSTVRHFPPELLPPLTHQAYRNGLGKGVIRLIVDNRGQVIGYWAGVYWGEGDSEITHPTYTDLIGLARLVPDR